MTTIALRHATLPTGRARRVGVLSSLRLIFAGIGDALEMAARYRTLSQMSDEQLARLNLKRQDIPRLIVFGRES